MIKKLIIFSLLATALIYACKEKFNPDINYPNTGYLVVEGFINSGAGSTNIRLSRTVKLTDSARRFENGATVTIEGDNNSRYLMFAAGQGLYTIGQLNLDRTKKFRLHIRTSAGREYFSDYSQVLATPPIDSVSFTRESAGISININTHDPQNKTRYYTWNYDETWEINARFYPSLKYVRNAQGKVVDVTNIYPNGARDTTRFRCWQFQSSAEILIGSSIKLTVDQINLPVYSIPYGSIKTGILYSTIFYQHALSEKGYDFLQRMKKNTQQVGSIFDSQPSELNSNVHNIADPTEIIIGFVEVSDARELRMYIDPAKVNLRPYSYSCFEYQVPYNRDSLDYYSYLEPIEFASAGPGTTVYSVSPICADCTLSGTNRRPSFWPR